MAISDLNFDDLVPQQDKKKTGIAGLDFSDLIPKQTNDAAARPSFNLPGFGNVETPENESGFNLPAAVIGSGRALDKLNRGVAQLKNVGMGTVATALGADRYAGQLASANGLQSQQEGEKDAAYKQLEDVHPGSTLIGSTAPLAVSPARALPALAAAAYGTPEERAIAGGAAFAGNALAEKAGKIAVGRYRQSAADAPIKQQASSVLEDNLAAARAEGFKTMPSLTNPSMANLAAESAGGKLATEQALSNHNAALGQKLILRELGMKPGTPLTEETVGNVSKQAFQDGYAPIKSAGQFHVSPDFGAELDSITAQASAASQSFPGALNADIAKLVDSFRPPSGVFDAGHAIDATRLLRKEASDAFRKGENEIGRTKRAVSDAIENELERQLAAAGQPGAAMLQKFRDSRQLMAKAHDVEDAIRTGTGQAEAAPFARMAQNNPGKLSGGLKTYAEFANAFPTVNKRAGNTGMVSKLGAWMSGITAAGGAASLGPMGLAAGALPIVGSGAMRSAIMSQPWQRLMTLPNHRVKGLLAAEMLDNPMVPYAAGLLGYGGSQ